MDESAIDNDGYIMQFAKMSQNDTPVRLS